MKISKPIGCLSIIAVLVIVGGLFNFFLKKGIREEAVKFQPKKEVKQKGPTQKAREDKILETRVASRDGINIRIGPGTNYQKDESGQLFKGEQLYVLEERSGWIRFRVTLQDIGWSGWVKKSLTGSMAGKREAEIEELKKSGLLTKVNPNLNEAFVNPLIWQGLNYQAKENIGAILAFYCGIKKGTGLNWVDIKDSRSRKRLAKYSENWGFKIY